MRTRVLAAAAALAALLALAGAAPSKTTPPAQQPGAVTVIGPYHFTAADIDQRGDAKALVTLAVGTVVVGWSPNPDTFTAIDADLYMGQGPEFNAADVPTLYQAGAPIPGGLGSPGHNGDAFPYDSGYNAYTSGGYGRYDRDGLLVKTPLLITQTADPIRVVNAGDGTPATVGDMDLYFYVAKPTLTLP